LMPRNITQHAVIALYNRRDLCIFNTEFFKEPLRESGKWHTLIQNCCLG